MALVAVHEWVSISSPVLNTALYLASMGYDVDLFVVQSRKFQMPKLGDERIRVYVLENVLLRSCLFRELEIVVRRLIPPRRYRFLVGFDPDGLLRAGFLSMVWRVSYLYHSLEINEYADNCDGRIRKAVERYFAKRAMFILTQDETRAEIVARGNNVPLEKILVLYNTGIGSVLTEKDDYLRKRLGIPQDRTIVLATGTLGMEHCIEKIVRSVEKWPDKFVLVLHGWFYDSYYENRVRSYMSCHADKVFISTELIPFEEKYRIFKSADIGLVFYEPFNTNMRYTGASSGKLFDFMRAGVPVIANDLPGMRQLVEGNGVGIVVKGEDDIGDALSRILEAYRDFREMGFETYERYEFSTCYSKILGNIALALHK